MKRIYIYGSIIVIALLIVCSLSPMKRRDFLISSNVLPKSVVLQLMKKNIEERIMVFENDGGKWSELSKDETFKLNLASLEVTRFNNIDAKDYVVELSEIIYKERKN